MQKDCEDILFPEEIIPWDEVLKLAVVLLIPYRFQAKGIECLPGGLISFRQFPGAPISWLPCDPRENDWQFINEHLPELPSLEFPVPLGVANEFIDKFITLKDSPNFTPRFLTGIDLRDDMIKRESRLLEETEQLKQRVENHEISLIDTSRRKCRKLTPHSYFSKREAVQYLDKMGLLERALNAASSFRDQINDTRVDGLCIPDEGIAYGLPKELISMGVQEYRKIVALRKIEAITKQLDQLQVVRKEPEQAVLTSSSDNIPVVPVTVPASIVPDERHNTISADFSSLSDASSLSTFGGPYSDLGSSEQPIGPKNDDAKVIGENSAAESKIAATGINQPLNDQLLDMKEVMERLGVSRPTIYAYTDPKSHSYNPGFPEPIKLNGRNRWKASAINAFVESLPTSCQKKKK